MTRHPLSQGLDDRLSPPPTPRLFGGLNPPMAVKVHCDNKFPVTRIFSLPSLFWSVSGVLSVSPSLVFILPSYKECRCRKPNVVTVKERSSLLQNETKWMPWVPAWLEIRNKILAGKAKRSALPKPPGLFFLPVVTWSISCLIDSPWRR